MVYAVVNPERENNIGGKFMKKSIKNTIMIGMAAVLIGTSAITVSYAKGSRSMQMPTPPSQSQQSDENQNGNPFENFSQNSGSQNSNSSQQPQMPNQQNGNSSQQPQRPDGNSSATPQAPNNEQSDSNSNQSKSDSSTESSGSSSTNTSLSIEALAAEDADAQTSQQMMPANDFKGRNTSVISALCYMFSALQIAIILAILAYLIISKFNEVSFNEVLANMRKSNKEA